MFSFFKNRLGSDLEPPRPFVRAVEVFVQAFAAEYRVTRTSGSELLDRLIEAHHPAYTRITEIEGTNRCLMAIALFSRASKTDTNDYDGGGHWIHGELIRLGARLVSKRGSVAPTQYAGLIRAWSGSSTYFVSYSPIVILSETLVAEYGLLPELEVTIRSLAERLETPSAYATHTVEDRRLAARLRRLIDPRVADELDLPEPWQVPFRAQSWKALATHAAAAKSTAMSDRWAKTALPILKETGQERFLETFEAAVSIVSEMRRAVDPLHADMLRGLAWFAGLTGTAAAASKLGRLVIVSAHKLEWIGARSQKGFSGAVGALEKMGTFESLAELSKARNRIKSATLSATLVAALTRAAEKQEMPLEDLEEIVVPTFGLDLPGTRTEILGSVEARVEVVGSTDVRLRWLRDGKELKAPPIEVKNEHPEVLKELKAVVKELGVSLAAQRSRIERMLMNDRTLPYDQWRERYLDHPLLANMVRRLVWRFAMPDGEVLGMPVAGEPLNVEGFPIQNLVAETMVRLWHPIHAGASAIEAWREFIVSREIRQPFKQGYREVYILTAAEETTETYSNRFAAHILKQHQLNALARGRGWRYRLQGDFDGQNNPTLDLGALDLTVEYYVEATDLGGRPDSEVISELGISLYVSTDQVRFADRAGRAIRLAAIPPTVFSEVMRDVDLFVGVASVGNDPTWVDQGDRFGLITYWQSVSFGDLSITAEMRREVLERLLPRLTIASVAKIDGRFLVVKGKRRTYKIHLGSGNILMEPNDQYLCIVPGQSKDHSTDEVYLPFDGDWVLSVIISKAMMLANDNKITDPTILRQL